MPATFIQGEYSRVFIEGTAYHVKKWSIKFKRPRLDVSNTEGMAGNSLQPDTLSPGYAAGVRGLYAAEVTLEEATFDADLNMFLTPISMQADDYTSIKIYPVRGGDYHYFPSLLIEEISHEGEVGGLQPVTFTGSSDGIFYLYGDAKP